MKYYILIFLAFLSSNSIFAFTGKGTGTEKDPYQITTILQLQEMNDTSNHGEYWILMNDIDASETKTWNVGDHDYNLNTPDEAMGFEPINLEKNEFLDGKGFIIKNLYINRRYSGIGLIGYCLGGFINGLGLVDCNINGGDPAGSICGWLEGSINMCFATGKVTSAGSLGTAGGICGYFLGSISNSYSLCTVNAAEVSSFCGWSAAISNPVWNCYAIGKATGDTINNVFGGDAHSSIWNIETTGSKFGGGNSFGRTTAEMKKRSTYDSIFYGFDQYWCIDEEKDYPKLKIFGDCPTDVFDNDKIKYNDFSILPNPATDYIEISVGARHAMPLQIRIYNVFGQEINLTQSKVYPTPALPGGEGVRIDVSSFSPGIYFVRFGERVGKFVKI